MQLLQSPHPLSRTRATSWHRSDIQGLRAIAVVVVVAYHAGVPGLGGGFTGVDMFFVISGYVITEMLLRQWHRDGRVSLGQFFLRRFKRLVPALAFVVALTATVSVVLLPPLADENRVLWTAIGAMTLTANLVLQFQTGDYFGQVGQLNPLLHTWSLSVEEQFYLGFPLLILAALVFGRRRGQPLVWMGIAITGVLIASFIVTIAGSLFLLPFGDALFGFYSPISRSWEFAAGAVLSLLPRTAPRLFRRLTTPFAGIGLVMLAIGWVLISPASGFPGLWTLLPVGGTVLLIVAGRWAKDNPISKVLGLRPLSAVGDWSYSLYLWHWPLIVFAKVLWGASPLVIGAAVALSLVLAVGTFLAIENPLRKRDLPSTRQVVTFGLIVLGAPALVLAMVWWVSTRIILPTIEDTIGKPTQFSFSQSNDCITGSRFTEDWPTRCTVGRDRPGDPIYLIGDSTAAHWDEAVLVAGEELGRPVTIMTAHSCFPSPYLAITRQDGTRYHEHCAGYHGFLENYFTTEKSGTIIMAFHDGSARDSSHYLVPGGTPEGDTLAKLDLVTRTLVQVTKEKRDLGYDVVIIQPVPNFREVGTGFQPLNCSIFRLLDSSCTSRVSEQDMDALQRPVREAINAVASQSSARILDFRDVWCRDGVCLPTDDGRINYRDDIHISAEQSRDLASRFVDALRAESPG